MDAADVQDSDTLRRLWRWGSFFSCSVSSPATRSNSPSAQCTDVSCKAVTDNICIVVMSALFWYGFSVFDWCCVRPMNTWSTLPNYLSHACVFIMKGLRWSLFIDDGMGICSPTWTSAIKWDMASWHLLPRAPLIQLGRLEQCSLLTETTAAAGHQLGTSQSAVQDPNH